MNGNRAYMIKVMRRSGYSIEDIMHRFGVSREEVEAALAARHRPTRAPPPPPPVSSSNLLFTVWHANPNPNSSQGSINT